MRNFNRWRGPILGVSALTAVGAIAIFGPGDEKAPQDGAARVCTGNITNLAYETFTKDGDAYRVSAIAGGECATIYDPATRRDLGEVRVGQTVLACTFLADKPARLHVMNPIAGEPYVVGDSNLTSEGVSQVRAEGVASCDAMGIPDIGFRFPEDASEPPIAPLETQHTVTI
jgi:hypothetical protein